MAKRRYQTIIRWRRCDNWKLAVRGLISAKFIAVLLLMALLSSLLPRAMAASVAHHPCQSITVAHGTHAVAANHPCPDTPRKAPMSGDCLRMIECSVVSAFGTPESIRGQIVSEGDESVYWMSVSLLAGRTVPPDLFPPIAI